jgi:hypothetical protein
MQPKIASVVTNDGIEVLMLRTATPDHADEPRGARDDYPFVRCILGARGSAEIALLVV